MVPWIGVPWVTVPWARRWKSGERWLGRAVEGRKRRWVARCPAPGAGVVWASAALQSAVPAMMSAAAASLD